jgi:hypothetical protein
MSFRVRFIAVGFSQRRRDYQIKALAKLRLTNDQANSWARAVSPDVIARRDDEAISSRVSTCDEIINVVKALMSSLRSVVRAALAMTWFWFVGRDPETSSG